MPLWGIAKHRGNTKPPQKIIKFCPFLAYFEPLCPVRGVHIVQPPRWVQVLPVLPVLPIVKGCPRGCKRSRKPTTPQAHKDRRTRDKGTSQQGTQRKKEPEHRKGQGTRARKRKSRSKPTSPQKGVPPPIGQGIGNPSPHHKFAPKNQQKVAWGRFEKIFGKIFRWNVSGERKTPRVISTEGAHK